MSTQITNEQLLRNAVLAAQKECEQNLLTALAPHLGNNIDVRINVNIRKVPTHCMPKGSRPMVDHTDKYMYYLDTLNGYSATSVAID